MPSRLPTAHLVQPAIAWEGKAANHEHVRRLLDPLIDADKIAEGDLIQLPEMFDTGFSFNVEATNDKTGETLQFLLDLADDTKAIVAGGRTIAPCHQCAAKNVMTIVGPGQKMIAEYTKSYLFSPGGENKRFEPGNEVVTWQWPAANLKVQTAICYDLRFPELFRAGLAQGAQLIALGACWPNVRQHHWRSLLIARAIENQAIVLGVNRSGDDPVKINGDKGLHYAGGTIAIGPKGEVLGELGEEAAVLSVPVDTTSVTQWREQFGAWRDMKSKH